MNQKFYINFRDETGEIWKLTNELDLSTPYIEIDRETMRDFAEERKKMDDHIVVPSSDPNLKYEIKFKHKDLSEFDVDKSIHHLPKVTSYDTPNAFVITQNIENDNRYHKMALSWNIMTMMSFFIMYIFELKRENWSIRYLDIDNNKSLPCVMRITLSTLEELS